MTHVGSQRHRKKKLQLQLQILPFPWQWPLCLNSQQFLHHIAVGTSCFKSDCIGSGRKT
jgi:hypothetical protein